MATYFSTFDWFVLIVYFIATMSIGFYFYRKSRSIECFTAANRSLPGWVCGLSIFATYLSSISFLALPGKSYSTNWNPFVLSLSLPIATCIAVYFFLPYYRKSCEVSAYSHLERRFGLWAHMYASFFYLLTQLARMGTVMYLMALPLSMLLGWDIRIVILITGISVTIYSFVGGIVAVIWVDALQAIILMIGAILCSIVLFFSMPEGPNQIFSIASQFDKFSLGSFGPSLRKATFWIVLIYGVVINLQNFGIDQNFVQRYIASKSAKEARKSVWLGGLLYVPISAIFFLIGTQLFAYYTVHPNDLSEVQTATAKQKLIQEGICQNSANFAEQFQQTAGNLTTVDVGDKVFPHFIVAKLPKGITGLIIAAIFAAAMSTISTSLNSSATLLVTDWYKRHYRPNASEKETILGLYFATIAWGLLGTGIAFMLISVNSVLDAWWTLSGIFGGSMLGIFLLGMISKKANNPIAITGTLIGIIVICWMVASPKIEGLPFFFKKPFPCIFNSGLWNTNHTFSRPFDEFCKKTQSIIWRLKDILTDNNLKQIN